MNQDLIKQDVIKLKIAVVFFDSLYEFFYLFYMNLGYFQLHNFNISEKQDQSKDK